MKEQEIYDAWTEFINDERYKEYFMSNEEQWYENLKKVKEFMDTHQKRPSSTNEEEKSLGLWIHNQKTNYGKNIMKEETGKNIG